MDKGSNILNKRKILEKFCSKAGCFHSQQSAHNLMNDLVEYLTIDQHGQLLIAWGHWDIGEGREELNEVRDKILKSWDND